MNEEQLLKVKSINDQLEDLRVQIAALHLQAQIATTKASQLNHELQKYDNRNRK